MTDAPPGNVVYGTLRATLPMPVASATGTVTWGSLARGAAEMVRAPDTTAADLQALAVVVQSTLREVERLRAAAAATAGTAASTHWWTVAGALAGWVSVLVAVLTLVQGAITDAQPDPPPSVTVVVERPDPAEIARRVDERLREIEQQRNADQSDPPGTSERRDTGSADVSP